MFFSNHWISSQTMQFSYFLISGLVAYFIPIIYYKWNFLATQLASLLKFLNQISHEWYTPGFFHKILFTKSIFVYVCIYFSMIITNGMICTPYDGLNKLYSFYKAAIVDIISCSGLRAKVHHRNQSNKWELALHILLLSLQQSFKTVVH